MFAVDWFDGGDWKPYEPPPHLASLKKKVGKDLAHITLGADAPSGWQPRYEASGLASAVRTLPNVSQPAASVSTSRAPCQTLSLNGASRSKPMTRCSD
jgi:hypothetical protein